MILYSYWRSSAAYRVRIALAVKGIDATQIPVHLLKDGGQQKSAEYRALNPAGLVPCLVDGDFTLNQSLAILEYLETIAPEPSLLGTDAKQTAFIRALALDIACDIHPLNNLRVLQYLTGPLQLSEQQKLEWIQHWVALGFSAIEQRLQDSAGLYCFGDVVTLADVVLVPQVYNALRFNQDMTPYPHIHRIYQNLNQLPAFKAATPEQQPDANS